MIIGTTIKPGGDNPSYWAESGGDSGLLCVETDVFISTLDAISVSVETKNRNQTDSVDDIKLLTPTAEIDGTGLKTIEFTGCLELVRVNYDTVPGSPSSAFAHITEYGIAWRENQVPYEADLFPEAASRDNWLTGVEALEGFSMEAPKLSYIGNDGYTGAYLGGSWMPPMHGKLACCDGCASGGECEGGCGCGPVIGVAESSLADVAGLAKNHWNIWADPAFGWQVWGGSLVDGRTSDTWGNREPSRNSSIGLCAVGPESKLEPFWACEYDPDYCCSCTITVATAGRDCDAEHIVCYGTCMAGSVPWPMNLSKGAKGAYCASKCLAEYMACLASEAAKRVVIKLLICQIKAAQYCFETMDEALEWVRNNPGKAAIGTIVVVAGICFIVATGGSGSVILVAA